MNNSIFNLLKYIIGINHKNLEKIREEEKISHFCTLYKNRSDYSILALIKTPKTFLLTLLTLMKIETITYNC